MYKFKELSVGVMVLLTMASLIIYYYSSQENELDRLNNLDFNKDGVVSRQELKYYLSLVHASNKKKRLKKNELIKSSVSGVIRGFLMGFILGNAEGGMALALILGILNPMLIGTETLFIK